MKKYKSKECIDNAYRQFFEAMHEGGVEEIVNTAHKIFNSPVLFTDKNYRLIYQVPDKTIGNPIWDELYKNKTLSQDTIWEYQKQYLNDKINNYEPFYADWGLVEDSPRIFGEVYNKEQIFGHIAIFLMDKPLQENDLKIAQIFVDALQMEVQKRREGNEKLNLTAAAYLFDLLDKESSHQLKKRANEQLKNMIPGKYAVLATPIEMKASTKAFSTYAITELSLMYSNITSIMYNSSIITLIGGIIPGKFKVEENRSIKGIIDFFKKENLVSGLSEIFDNLHDINMKYLQALQTARIVNHLNNEKTPLGIYQDYVPLQMFLSIADESMLDIYIHPVLKEIKEYDQENNTEYFRTLEEYSLSMHNKISCADKMSIHRNTLLYRLNRINELFDLSCEDRKISLHLLCSFLLMEANKV